jgi:hypothetical protein
MMRMTETAGEKLTDSRRLIPYYMHQHSILSVAAITSALRRLEVPLDKRCQTRVENKKECMQTQLTQ